MQNAWEAKSNLVFDSIFLTDLFFDNKENPNGTLIENEDRWFD